MANTRLHSRTFITLSGCVCLATTAMAQSNSEPVLETITVEARYWKEKLIDVPNPVTQLNDVYLDPNANIHLIPQSSANVILEDSSVQTRISIRGATSLDGGLQDPVGYFVNGTALPQGGNQLPALPVFESVELIKGPQGTLYGRNNQSGAIKLETVSPDWSPNGYIAISQASLEGANKNTNATIISATGTSSLIEDKLAGAVSIVWQDSDGAYLNNLNNSRQGGESEAETFSVGLLYAVNDNTDVLLKSVVDKTDQGRNRFRFSDGLNRTDRFITNADTNGFDNDQIDVHTLEINSRINNLHFTSITGLTDYQRDFSIDLDATPLPLPATQLDLDNNSLSQEFRLSSTIIENLKWVAGVYFYREESDINFSISPMFATTQRATEIEQNGQAVFGQIEYSINPYWRLALGGRYENINQSGSQEFSNFLGNFSYDQDINENEFLSKASISYKPNQDNLLYLAYSEGYLPGGYNYNSAGDEESFGFSAEYSHLIELGWKQNTFNNRLNTHITLFQVTTEDKQIVDLLPGFIQSISNAGETESYGLEVEVKYQISPAATAYFNAGVQRSEAVNFIISTFGNRQDLSGNDLTYSPQHNFSAGLIYNPDHGVFGRVDLRSSGDYYFDNQNTLEQSGFEILDAEFGYRFKHISVSLWAKNITDEEVINRAVSTPNGTVVEDNLPRTFGIKLTAKLP